MENRDYEKLAELFKEFHGSSTPETEIDVRVEETGIELYPAKERYWKDTFYHIEEVTDFCRVMKLSCYVTISDDKQIVVLMY